MNERSYADRLLDAFRLLSGHVERNLEDKTPAATAARLVKFMRECAEETDDHALAAHLKNHEIAHD